MFICTNCTKVAVSYDHQTHTFVCAECGHKEVREPRYSVCPRCGALYVSYAWFDPSGCPQCGRSFVD